MKASGLSHNVTLLVTTRLDDCSNVALLLVLNFASLDFQLLTALSTRGY